MFDLGIFNSSDRTLPFRLDVIQRSAGESLFITDEWPLAAAHAIASGLAGPPSWNSPASTPRLIRSLSENSWPTWRPSCAWRKRPNATPREFLGLVVCNAVVRGVVDPPTAMNLISPLCGKDDLHLAFSDAWDWDMPEYREYITDRVTDAAMKQLASMPGTLEETLVRITTAGFESAPVGDDDNGSTRLPNLEQLQDDAPINIESKRRRLGWLATIVQRIRP